MFLKFYLLCKMLILFANYLLIFYLSVQLQRNGIDQEQ
jgi:hypothetical protein